MEIEGMDESPCMACKAEHDTAKEPRHHPEGRPNAWICDDCWRNDGRIRKEWRAKVSPTEGIEDEMEWVARWHRDRDDLARVDEPDLVNEPPHYKGLVVRVPQGKTSPSGMSIAVEVESSQLRNGFAKSMGFSVNLTDALKYLYRCDKKGNKEEDLEKCIKSIKLEINNE